MPAPDDSDAARRVLLCLDIQAGVLSKPPRGVPSAGVLRRNLGQVLAAARAATPPPLIIHVRNTGEFGDVDAPHTPGWQLVHTPLPHEPLGELIPPDAEIVIVGLQSDFSVRATCSAALGRGNEVLLIHGAHGTYDRIEVLYGGGVTSAAQIENDIEGELQEAGVHLLDMKDLNAIFHDR
ncbi:hypothetical protein B0H14DRAFT_3111703 [Mycena olivaceomarginata]|nr:hypothetical protein B0H14DRAFT_3111703 [Mycena olivaceomarginata]